MGGHTGCHSTVTLSAQSPSPSRTPPPYATRFQCREAAFDNGATDATQTHAAKDLQGESVMSLPRCVEVRRARAATRAPQTAAASTAGVDCGTVCRGFCRQMVSRLRLAGFEVGYFAGGGWCRRRPRLESDSSSSSACGRRLPMYVLTGIYACALNHNADCGLRAWRPEQLCSTAPRVPHVDVVSREWLDAYRGVARRV